MDIAKLKTYLGLKKKRGYIDMFDNTFSVGSEIYATWTNSNKIYLTKVKIIKENKKTWVIEVISPIKNTDTIFKEKYPYAYPVGQSFNIPKVDTPGYSKNNRLIHQLEIEEVIKQNKDKANYHIGEI